MALRATVTASGRLSLPSEMRRRHGLSAGGTVIVEDRGDAIVLRTLDQVVAESRAIAERLGEGRREQLSSEALMAARRNEESDR